MTKRFEMGNGLVITQAENNHVTIKQNNKIIAHIQCDKELNERQMSKLYSDLFDIFNISRKTEQNNDND